MSAALVTAVRSRIAAAPLTVHDSLPTGSSVTYPYVVAYFDAAPRQSDRVADKRVQRLLSWNTVVVGLTGEQCRAALDRLTTALEDWRPTIPGYASGKVEHPGSQPTRRDTDLPDRVLYIATDQWRLLSDPSA